LRSKGKNRHDERWMAAEQRDPAIAADATSGGNVATTASLSSSAVSPSSCGWSSMRQLTTMNAK
jgi:hypothetical protein